MGTVKDKDLSSELLQAIVHFIERQQLVIRVLKELNIDLNDMGKWGTVIWTKQGKPDPQPPLRASASDANKALWSAIERARSRKPVIASGTWGKSGEWTYSLHGKGCLLHNNITGEEIDWDCPNPQRFDRYFFLEHLRWRLETEKESLPHIRGEVASNPDGINSIISLIQQMVEVGLINPDYTLPSSTMGKS